MMSIQNISLKNIRTVVLHPKLYDSEDKSIRASVENIEFNNITKLQVRRHSFQDVEVTNRVYLADVRMSTMVSMAFEIHYVREFSIFASHFERISRHGIKISSCKEFNVLGMTYFGSLAPYALKVKAHKFSLAYNWFGLINDSSFDVEYGLCDIQGNTFNSIGGKPFLSMMPVNVEEEKDYDDISMHGLVFRENKFASEPVLPFASLVMPSYGLLSPSTSYLDTENNQFPCSCNKLGWLLLFGKFGYNSNTLAEFGRGSNDFLKLLYSSAGQCIICDGLECESIKNTFDNYTENSVEYTSEGVALCKRSGLRIQNYDNTSDMGSEEDSKQSQPINNNVEDKVDITTVNMSKDYDTKQITTKEVIRKVVTVELTTSKDDPDKMSNVTGDIILTEIARANQVNKNKSSRHSSRRSVKRDPDRNERLINALESNCAEVNLAMLPIFLAVLICTYYSEQ